MQKITPEAIDALLPQTQCQQCGFSGCLPYAKAIVQDHAALDLCLPGGVATLKAIGQAVQRDVQPLLSTMAAKKQPLAVAIIREEECIGCAKCIAVCPVDAIIGSAKYMHTVLPQECTGCELCVPACPVDCIDMQELPVSTERTYAQAQRARNRFYQKKHRQQLEQRPSLERDLGGYSKRTLEEKQAYIKAAVARARLKKGTKQSGAKQSEDIEEKEKEHGHGSVITI